jgi:predicted ArsR family transcriptional regulator
MTQATKSTKTKSLLLETLRRGPASADDLAAELALTANAVRFHLESLESEGVVEVVGSRKPAGAGKPAILYMLTPETDLKFSKAYAPVLEATVRELRSALPANQVTSLLRRVGKSLAKERGDPNRSLSRRVKDASDALNALGGLTTVTHTSDGYTIRGRGCPLGAVVSEEPCVCGAVESLLTTIVGAPVREHCDRTGRPSCCFEISTRTQTAR